MKIKRNLIVGLLSLLCVQVLSGNVVKARDIWTLTVLLYEDGPKNGKSVDTYYENIRCVCVYDDQEVKALDGAFDEECRYMLRGQIIDKNKKFNEVICDKDTDIIIAFPVDNNIRKNTKLFKLFSGCKWDDAVQFLRESHSLELTSREHMRQRMRLVGILRHPPKSVPQLNLDAGEKDVSYDDPIPVFWEYDDKEDAKK